MGDGSFVDLDNRDYELPEIGFEFRGPRWLGARQLDLARWPAARLYALEFAKPEYAERHAREVEQKLHGDQYRRLLKNMYGDGLRLRSARYSASGDSANGMLSRCASTTCMMSPSRM